MLGRTAGLPGTLALGYWFCVSQPPRPACAARHLSSSCTALPFKTLSSCQPLDSFLAALHHLEDFLFQPNLVCDGPSSSTDSSAKRPSFSTTPALLGSPHPYRKLSRSYTSSSGQPTPLPQTLVTHFLKVNTSSQPSTSAKAGLHLQLSGPPFCFTAIFHAPDQPSREPPLSRYCIPSILSLLVVCHLFP